MRKIHCLAQKGDYAEIAALSDETLSDETSDYYINSTDSKHKQTPLFFAAYNGHIETVKLLLDRKANASIAGESGLNVLHVIIWRLTNKEDLPEILKENIFETIKLLLKNEPDLVTAKDINGFTPLDYAKRKSVVFIRISKIVDELHIAKKIVAPSSISSKILSSLWSLVLPKKVCEITIAPLYHIHPGLQYQLITGDGDCFYRAVSCYLDHGEDVSFLRSMVAANLEYNRAQYADFIPLRDSQSIQDYIAEIRNTRTWAGDLEINILMRLLDRPIVIIGPDGIIRNKEAVNQYTGKEPIFVFYNGGDERGSAKPGHYDALLLRDGYDARSILSEILNSAYESRISQLSDASTPLLGTVTGHR